MTEDEAKKKYCWRTVCADVPRQDGSSYWPAPAFCLGSECMAWRWNQALLHRRHAAFPGIALGSEEPRRPDYVPASWEWREADDDLPARWVEPEKEAQARRSGYCGLADKP